MTTPSPFAHKAICQAREQLMEDIDSIIESNFGLVDYKDEVVKQLCDAVCKNFPSSDQ